MGITQKMFKQYGPFGILFLPSTLIGDTLIGVGTATVALYDVITDFPPRCTKEVFKEIGPFAIFVLPHTLVVDTACKTTQVLAAGVSEACGLNDSYALNPTFNNISCSKEDYSNLKIKHAAAIKKKLVIGAHHWSLILTIKLRNTVFTYVLLQKDSSGKIGCASYKNYSDAIDNTYGKKGTQSIINASDVDQYWYKYFNDHLEPKEFYRFATNDCQEFVRRQFEILTGYEINLGM